jgi:hypothetical protein
MSISTLPRIAIMQTPPTSERRRARLMAVAAAPLAALAIWTLAELAIGIPLRAPEGFGASGNIGPLDVVIASALLSLAGWGLLALLERVTAHARTVWVVFAVVALVLSLGTPLSGTGVTAANRFALVLMHLAVGGVLIPAMYRTAPRMAREMRPSRASLLR